MTGGLIAAALFTIIGSAASRFAGQSAPFLLGLGITGSSLFLAMLIGLPPLPVLLLLAGVAIALWRPKFPAQFRSERVATIVTLVPIVAGLVVTAMHPLSDFDGRAFWMLKARALATERQIDGPFFHGGAVYSPRNEYPLLVPLDAAAVMMLRGGAEVEDVRWIYVLALASLAFHLRRWTGVWVAALVPWIPQFAVASEGSMLSAYNDLIVGAFLACAFLELVDASSAWRFGLWLAFLVLTKNEGFPLAFLLFAAGVFVFRAGILRAAVPLGIATAALFAWRSGIEPTDEEPFFSRIGKLIEQVDRVVPAAGKFIGRAFDVQNWGFFWIAVIVAIVIPAARREWRALVLPLAVIGAMAALYIAVYTATTWQLDDLINASASRLLMHFIGPAAYLIGACAQSRYGPSPHPPAGA